MNVSTVEYQNIFIMRPAEIILLGLLVETINSALGHRLSGGLSLRKYTKLPSFSESGELNVSFSESATCFLFNMKMMVRKNN